MLYDNYTHGTAQLHIDMKKFSEFQIPIPSLQTQKRIVEQCERIDKLIADLEADRETSKELAQNYLNSFIKSTEEVEAPQEYADIIISEEDYTEEVVEAPQEYADIIISEEDYTEEVVEQQDA